MRKTYNSIAASTVPAEILLKSLERLDQAGKEATARVLMAGIKALPRLGRAVESAIRSKMAEQRELDGWADAEEKRWLECEEEKDANRYALEK